MTNDAALSELEKYLTDQGVFDQITKRDWLMAWHKRHEPEWMASAVTEPAPKPAKFWPCEHISMRGDAGWVFFRNGATYFVAETWDLCPVSGCEAKRPPVEEKKCDHAWTVEDERNVCRDLNEALRLLRRARAWLDDEMMGVIGYKYRGSFNAKIDDFLREPKPRRV